MSQSYISTERHVAILATLVNQCSKQVFRPVGSNSSLSEKSDSHNLCQCKNFQTGQSESSLGNHCPVD